MLGDLLYINDLHNSAAEAIAKRILLEKEKLPKSYKFILGISGETGSGKSEISHSIALRLKKEHIRVKILHTGNYYKVSPLLLTEWRKTQGLETIGISEYDWNLLSRNIQDFKEDRESLIPIIDVVPEQLDKLITDFIKIDLLILTGLYAIKADGIDLRVCTELDFHDIQAGKNNLKSNDFNLKVLEIEHKCIQSIKNLADLLIDKNFQVIDAKTGESIMD